MALAIEVGLVLEKKSKSKSLLAGPGKELLVLALLLEVLLLEGLVFVKNESKSECFVEPNISFENAEEDREEELLATEVVVGENGSPKELLALYVLLFPAVFAALDVTADGDEKKGS